MRLTPEQRELVDLAIDLLACGNNPVANRGVGALTFAAHRLQRNIDLVDEIANLEDQLNGQWHKDERGGAEGRIDRLRRLRGDLP